MTVNWCCMEKHRNMSILLMIERENVIIKNFLRHRKTMPITFHANILKKLLAELKQKMYNTLASNTTTNNNDCCPKDDYLFFARAFWSIEISKVLLKKTENIVSNQKYYYNQ